MSEESAVVRMANIQGWFSASEARLLYRSARAAIARRHAVVEIGSYQGRSTVVLGTAAVDAGTGNRIYAIDPHEGVLSSRKDEPTWSAFVGNIRRVGLESVVVPIRKKSTEVPWTLGEIGLLFIDGLHDLSNVTADYEHFHRFVPPGGLIAFHDYANPGHPDVKAFVDGKVQAGEITIHGWATPKAEENTLVVTRKAAKLSVIIATCGRKRLSRALESLVLAGLKPTDEVIVVGDGPQPVARKIAENFPKSLSIRYFEHGPTRMVGAAQKNFAIKNATGTHLMFLDDDDESAPDAIAAVRGAAEANPGRILIFKEESKSKWQPWGVIWKGREISLGNVGTQGIVVPNIRGRLGTWPDRRGSDYHFLRSTLNLYPERDGAVVWIDRIIAYLFSDDEDQGVAGAHLPPEARS